MSSAHSIPLQVPAPGRWVLDRANHVVDATFAWHPVDGSSDVLLDALDRWLRMLRRSGAPNIAHPELLEVDGQITLRWPAPAQVGSHLMDATLPVDHKLRMLDLVARALDGLHAHGVVHAGLGIDSIWIDDDAISFPDASLNDALTGILPTPPLAATYAAPEVRHAREPEAATDVYALAVIAHEVLSGAARSQIATADGVTSLDAVIVEPHRAVYPGAPPALADVIARGLASAPAARYASCGLFTATLQRASRATPGSVLAIPASETEVAAQHATHTDDRGRTLAAVIAVGLAAGALVGYVASDEERDGAAPPAVTALATTVLVPRDTTDRVFVDGVLMASSDSLIAVSPGLHDIEVHRADGTRVTRRLDVPSGQTTRFPME